MAKTGEKQRYKAMKKYFSYNLHTHSDCSWSMPCKIEFNGEEYISFCNGYSIVLTPESTGDIELFKHPEKYCDVAGMISFDGEPKEVNIDEIIADAVSKGYKLIKSEMFGSQCKYALHYDGAYFKIGQLDAAYRIIKDGGNVTVWHSGMKKKTAPLVIRNNIGICVVVPVMIKEKDMVTVLEVSQE